MPLPRNAAGDIDLDAISHGQGLARPSAEFMDIPKAFGAGAGEGTQGIGEGMQATGRQLARNAVSDPASGGIEGLTTSAGLDMLGDLLSSAGKSVGDYFTEHMSEGGKAVNQMPITESVKNPLNIPQVTAKMFGQVAPVLAGSAVAGPAGATGLGFLQNQGMTHASASQQAQEAINQLNNDQLMQSPTFVKLFQSIDQSPQYKNYSDLQKIDLTKAQLAETAAMGALNNLPVLMANIASAYTGDAELGRLMTGDAMKWMEKSLPGILTKHMGKNAVINGGVTGLQQWAINNELNKLGIGHRDAMQGVKESAEEGAAGGALMALPPAVVGHIRQRLAKGKAETSPEAGDSAGSETQTKVDEAVDDIQEGTQKIKQGEQALKEELNPAPDLFSQNLGDEQATPSPWDKQGKGLGRQVRDAVSSGPVAPERSTAAGPAAKKDVWGRDVPAEPPESRSGLTEEEVTQQRELAKGFDDREKFGGNRPDEFADVPAYLRAGKTIHADPDPRPTHMVDSGDVNGQVKARFDNPHDADIFQAADQMDLYTRGKHPDPNEEEYQALKDWFYRMTRGVSRQEVEAGKKKSRKKKGDTEADSPKKQPHSDEKAKSILDTIMGYHQFVKDAARGAENGEFTAPSMEDYARHLYPDRPLQLEDKNIIFAGGPAESPREPLRDESQAGSGPEFRGGERIRGQEFIPADRDGGALRPVNVIEGESRRIFPQLEDKNIIFSGGPVPDEGQRGQPPQFERGKTKAQRRLDRFEERVGSRHKTPALPGRKLSSGEITPPDAVIDAAKSGNGEVYYRRNGQPFPSEGLAKLSKPYTEAKKAGEKPKVVEVEGGYAVEVPPSESARKKPAPPKPAEKPAPEPPPKAPEKKPEPATAEKSPEPAKHRPPVEGLPIDVSPDDIPFDDARDAFAGSSMNPEKRAREQQDGYVETIRNLYHDMQDMATPQNESRIPELLQKYRDGYRERLNAYLRSRHGTLSSAIAGRSNFDSKKNARNLSREQQQLDELTGWDTRFRKTIKEVLTRKTADETQRDALRQYNAYKEALEKMQKANAIIKHKVNVAQELSKLGLSDETIEAIMHPAFGKPGFLPSEMKKMEKGMEKHASAAGIKPDSSNESLRDKKGQLSDDEIASATDNQLQNTLRDIAADHYRGLSNTEKDVIRRLEKGDFNPEEARAVVRSHRDYWNRREAEGEAADKARDERLEQLYGSLSVPELEQKLAEMGGSIAGHRQAGEGEFSGNGTRKSGAAQSNEAARSLGEEKMRLERYLNERRDREQAAVSILSHDDHEAFFDRLIEHPDQVTPEQVKSALESTIANKDAILTALNKLTREKLRPYQGYYFDSSTKKDRMVATAYEALLNQYRWLTNKGDVMVTSGRQTNEERAREAIANITQQLINDYSAGIQKSREERKARAQAQKAALDDPQTMDDFRLFIKAKGRDALTAEQAARLDQLLADEQLAKQKEKAEAPRVTSGFSHDDELKINPIEEGKNSKTGETIYNVNLETRLGTEKFKEAAATARKLGGGYWRGNFWFPTKEKAEQFTGWLRGDSVDHTADDAARREQKQERQAERLTESAERLQENAEDRLNADRKVNTAKRIREAAYATARAENDLRDAELLRKIAEGKADGSVKYLAGLQHKTQLDTLRQIARRLVYDIPQAERDDLSYTTWDGKREWNDNVPITTRVKYARFPMLDWSQIHLDELLPKMGQARGYKLAANELRRSMVKEHGLARLPAERKANDKLAAWLQDQPGFGPDIAANYNRLQRAGITTRPILRSALAELMHLDGEIPVREVPRLAKMEQDLRMKLARNRNAFIDFFPTPEDSADYFVTQADIQPGMNVLEPSAGHGVLADAARRAGANVDVVELAHDLREILTEKGHNVIGDDFDTFSPDKQYDRILMNPPFSDDMDIAHVRKAWEHLKPGGRLAAIVSSMAGERQNKRNLAFREWLDGLGATEELLPEGMFKDSLNPTSVRTKLITMDKPAASPVMHKIAELRKAFGPDTGYSRHGAELRQEISKQLDTDTGYKFNKLLDSQFKEDRQRAIDLAEQYLAKKAIPADKAATGESLTSTPAFKQWFGDSKVVDEKGQPLEVYHGTLAGDLKSFRPDNFFDSGLFGKGINFTSSKEDAGKYASADPGVNLDLPGKASVMADALGIDYNDAKKHLTKGNGSVIPVYLSIKNPLVVGKDKLTIPERQFALAAAEAGMKDDAEIARLYKRFNAAGDGKAQFEAMANQRGATRIYRQLASLRNNDGLIIEPDVAPLSKGATHYMAFEPTQIKSSLENSGAFDPANPDIRFSVPGKRADVLPRERILSGTADFRPRGLSKAKVEAEAARFLKKWKGAGGVSVEVARDLAEAEKLAGFALPDMHAAYLPNSKRVIMVADHLDSLAHVRAKLRHEILGHHALSEVVGPQEYEKLLRTVAAGKNSRSLKPYFDRVLENYDEASPWKQVEEVISHVMEDGSRGIIGRAWDRISGAVMQVLRKSGFLDENNLTAAEVRNLMKPVTDRLKRAGNWAEHSVEKPDDVAVRFSLTGKDGLFTKPRPGETETEATQRRSGDFGKVVQQTINNVHNLRPADILKRLTSRISTNALMISTLTNRQLAAVYSKLMKTDYAGHYQDLQAQMEARRNRIMNSAERGIENQWNTLGKEEGSKLSDLMHDATMTRIHPDRALAEQPHFQELKYEAERLKSTAFAPGNESELARYDVVKRELDAIRENYADLNNRWRSLSPEAKKLWKDTEKWYKNSYTELKNALMQRIQDVGGDQHAALISRVREQFEMALKDGPYFPLARFGKFVVTARKDGDYIREHFEDKASALAALEAYKKDGYDAVQTVKSAVNGTNQDSGYSVGKSILEMIQKSDDENLTKDVLTDKVWQSMLELMPDSSYARHFIRRRRVKGASHDARRAFANSAFHFAHHISKIEYGHLMGGVLDDMGNEIDAAMKGEYNGVQPENLETAQRMLDELKMRHEMTMNPSGDGFGNALTGAGYVFNMAANPSSALINMTQTALVALPQLAARYGWRNALKELGRATVDYFRSADKRFKWFGKDSSWLDRDAWLSMSRSGKLAPDEVELMKQLNADGVISITQASSLAQRAETDTQDKVHFNKALDMSILVGGQLFHNVEVANREVTALAAYRLAKAAGGGKIHPEDAYKIASNAVFDAHFDYSSSNRPRWMRKSWQKVIFQFKMYAQHMFYTLGRSLEQSFRGETPEVRRQARKEFMSYMLMHTLAAGVTGLPYAIQAIFGAAAKGIHSVVSDDESPWDPEIALKNWLHDELGGFAATAITDGVVNALGIDLHSRVGIQDLLWRSPPEGTEGKDLYVYYMEQMLGPTIGGIGLNFASGYDKMAKGDWLGGIQTVTPAAVRNLVKTYNEATRGITTASGEEVLAPDEFTTFELAAQSLGFTPSRISQAYTSRSAIKNAQSEYAGERSQLVQRYFSNAMNGDDNSGVLEDIEAYNRSNPDNAITGDMIIKAMRQKQKDRLKKARGLALSKKDEHLRQLGRFGDYSPLL